MEHFFKSSNSNSKFMCDYEKLACFIVCFWETWLRADANGRSARGMKVEAEIKITCAAIEIDRIVSRGVSFRLSTESVAGLGVPRYVAHIRSESQQCMHEITRNCHFEMARTFWVFGNRIDRLPNGKSFPLRCHSHNSHKLISKFISTIESFPHRNFKQRTNATIHI